MVTEVIFGILGMCMTIASFVLVVMMYIRMASLQKTVAPISKILTSVNDITASETHIISLLNWINSSYKDNETTIHQYIDELIGQSYATFGKKLKAVLSNLSANIKQSSLINPHGTTLWHDPTQRLYHPASMFSHKPHVAPAVGVHTQEFEY